MMQSSVADTNCMTPADAPSSSRRARNWPVILLEADQPLLPRFARKTSDETPNAMITHALHAYKHLGYCASFSLFNIHHKEGLMYHLTTEGGYEFGEVISALQKEIRRGKEEEAMYWALECFPYYSKALWVRLRVICNEDIGLADPMCSIFVNAQADHFFALEKEGSQRLILANAILYLCRAKKSRLADHFQCTILQRKLQQNWKLDVPDFAKDKHTRAGKHMGRSWDHWFKEGCLLVNEAKKLFDPYRKLAYELWPTRIDPAKARANTKKTGKADPLNLFDQEEP
jgi:hypothetical protein